MCPNEYNFRYDIARTKYKNCRQKRPFSRPISSWIPSNGFRFGRLLTIDSTAVRFEGWIGCRSCKTISCILFLQNNVPIVSFRASAIIDASSSILRDDKIIVWLGYCGVVIFSHTCRWPSRYVRSAASTTISTPTVTSRWWITITSATPYTTGVTSDTRTGTIMSTGWR